MRTRHAMPSTTCRMAGCVLKRLLAAISTVLVGISICGSFSSGGVSAAPLRMIHEPSDGVHAGTRRPPARDRRFTSEAVEALIATYTGRMKCPLLADLFANCLPNTLDTTVHVKEDIGGKPSTFIVTGDIDAMWLRDSTNQVLPYIRPAAELEDTKLQRMICGVINRQAADVALDPFANAFNPDDEGGPNQGDTRTPPMTPHIFEGKFELDSLAAFLKLSNTFAREVPDTSCFALDGWLVAVEAVLNTMEQMSLSTREELGREPYTFSRRTKVATDTLYKGGYGAPACKTGMIRSYFRPSDDACMLPFLVPANAMAAKELQDLDRTITTVISSNTAGSEDSARVDSIRSRAASIAEGIKAGLERFSTTVHPKHGEVFAYEVDGCGSSIVMDDAGIPSLLSLPLVGIQPLLDASVHSRTRKMLLSEDNPYFWRGTEGSGIGSPHIGPGYIWPMATIVQAMTAESDEEIIRCLEQLKASSVASGFIHESFWKDNATDFTRPWFAWANTLFGQLILELAQSRPHLIFSTDEDDAALRLSA